jgi:Domain of unknown function (DUF3303)
MRDRGGVARYPRHVQPAVAFITVFLDAGIDPGVYLAHHEARNLGPDERGGSLMQYMITWNERQQGSPIEYENAQKRILEVFSPWKAPANFKIHSFVIRVGDWGGYMLMECDDPLEVHKFCSMLPAFTFEARPVVPVADAIRVELEGMAYRDGLKK